MNVDVIIYNDSKSWKYDLFDPDKGVLINDFSDSRTHIAIFNTNEKNLMRGRILEAVSLMNLGKLDIEDIGQILYPLSSDMGV